MEQNWRNDPRLKAMNQEKLKILEQFSDRIQQTDQSHLMEAFVSMNREASQRGIVFNDKETALLVSILTSGMNPKEKKKLDLLRMLSKKLTGTH